MVHAQQRHLQFMAQVVRSRLELFIPRFMKLTPEQRAFVLEDTGDFKLSPEIYVASHDVVELGHAINAADTFVQKLTRVESRLQRFMGAGYVERLRLSGSSQASGSTGQPHSSQEGEGFWV